MYFGEYKDKIKILNLFNNRLKAINESTEKYRNNSIINKNIDEQGKQQILAISNPSGE